MKVSVVDVGNEKVSELELPKVFETPIRPDVIKKGCPVPAEPQVSAAR